MKIFTGFNILMAWLIYFIFNLLFFKKNTIKSWWILGLVGSTLLTSVLFEYAIAYYSGYLSEQIIRNAQVNKILNLFLIFEFIISFITTLNILKYFRENKIMRSIQINLIGLYLLGHIGLYGLSSFDFATSVIPGWHSTIVSIGNLLGIIMWLTAIFILDRITRMV